MNIEDAVLRDGRRLLDVWPEAAQNTEDAAAKFVSLPKDHRGYVLVECGDDAENHYVMVYVFLRTSQTDFCRGTLYPAVR